MGEVFYPLPGNYLERDSMLTVGMPARFLSICARLFCKERLNDGHFTEAQAKMLAKNNDVSADCIAELVASGEWELTEDGYAIVGWLDSNMSAEMIDAERERKSKALREGATYGNHLRWHVKRGVVSESCRYCEMKPRSIARRSPGDRQAITRRSPSVGPGHSEVETELQPEPEPDVEPQPEKEKETAPPLPSLPTVDDWFDKFWQSYPRKIAKPKARASFAKAMKKASIEDIRAGLRRWKTYWEQADDPEFTPHPTTWLNQERWNDEPPPMTRLKIERRHAPGMAGIAEWLNEQQEEADETGTSSTARGVIDISDDGVE